MKKFKAIASFCAVLMMAVSSVCHAESAADISIRAEDSGAELFSINYDMNGGFGKVDEAPATAAGDDVTLSVWALRKDGYSHVGWTDGETVYERGQTMQMPEKDIKLTAVWKKLYTLRFEDLSVYGYPNPFSDSTVTPGTEIYLPNYSMFSGNKCFNGWLVNGVYHKYLSYFTMPEEDVYVEVDWLAPIKFTYSAGDVDGVIGASESVLEKYPGSKYNLSDSTKLARLGYKLDAWYSEDDKRKYPLEYHYTIPDKDTTMYAVWVPIKVLLCFAGNGGEGSMDDMILEYDSVIYLPECSYEKEGYKLLGWKLNDKYYYAPESKFQAKIEELSQALEFEAVWIEEDITPGDINGDGKTDVCDLTALSMHLLGDNVITDEKLLQNADVLRNGSVELTDLAHYKQFLMKDKILLGIKGE